MARVTALLAELEDALRKIYPKITFGLGSRDLDRQDLAPPRVIWVPTTVRHGAPESKGFEKKDRSQPRRLLTRAPSIVAHCWAAADTPTESYDACEDLVHNLLVAIYRSSWGSVEMGGEEWLQPTHTDHGHVALVTFVPSVPVEAKTYQTVQPNKLELDATGAQQGDGVVEAGEP
jgi:hypothetical protein